MPTEPEPVEPALTEPAAMLRRALAGHGCDAPLDVKALGLHNAFATEPPRTGPSRAEGPPPDASTANASTEDAAADAAVPVRIYGHHAVVGPLSRTGSARRPCVHCLERRWQAVRSVALREALELGSGTEASGPSPYLTPFTADALAALIATLTARAEEGAGTEEAAGTEEGAGSEEAAGSENAAGAGTFPPVHVMDLRSLTVRRYPLVPDPECPRCAVPEHDTAEAAALTLRPAPKTAAGSFRVRSIDDYNLPLPAFANPVCGSLGPSVVLDVSSTSTSATIGCFSMRSGSYLRETFWGGHADTFGDSLRIGVLEGLERYAGMRARAKLTKVHDSLDGLRTRGEHALDPRDCGLYSDAFHEANPHVKPFAPDRAIPWVWGWSLRDAGPVLVPEVLTYYHAPGLENRFVQESSNGCASGGCLEEAVYFGLMEVVERDAFLLTWYGQARLPEIDPHTSNRPATRQMVDRLAMYGYEARFFDTRITFPVPVVTGVAVRHDGGLGRMCFGAGAGLDPEAALAGALCEIATDAVNLQGRTERDEQRLRAMERDFSRVAALHDHPLAYGIPEMGRHAGFLLGEPGEPRPPLRSMAALYGDGSVPPASDDLREDLDRCLQAVTGAGFDVIVVDQTMPEQRALGLRTVSVLVPGLLPIDFGWTRQRARHMPRMRTALREAGLREADLMATDLNPAPHPFP
ncbi:TOMM precursor leader peptide-binding protein [Streptomyces sp. NBC_00259]|uniref:TOMM precursor leader peptide-binding protein n=1 Tax=Streptomyces sp. NBC_00259 TaxID=2903643 RepID=UPI002E2A9FFF|nr:TOMM precursor leader peptide-binding protein [Streptomyces sp. NBC_00259]